MYENANLTILICEVSVHHVFLLSQFYSKFWRA